MHSIIPNSTQVPNVILDEIMPLLKEVELRVLLVVTRQTLGWIEDLETGRRKEQDWITTWQLTQKTGSKERAVQQAVTSLINKGLIEARDKDGNILDSSIKRVLAGGRVYYRLATNAVNKPLITLRKFVDKRATPAKFAGRKKGGTTKETVFTKLNTNNKYLKNSERQKNRKRLQDMKASILKT